MERQSATHDIDELQASMLRSLASAHRLRILHLLGAQLFEVNEIARDLGLNQAAVSQHLEAIRDGRTVRYRLADPQILAACELMRAVLVRRLSRLGDLAAAAHEPALHALPSTEVHHS
jgi:DNA-binding transcriptional ArsR family regulator